MDSLSVESTVNKHLSVNTTSVASQNEQDLLTLYVQGMNNYSSDLGKSLLRLASDKTGLSEREVKRWIDNYKKKVKRREHPSEHRVKLAKRAKRGIDVFYSENLSKQEGNTNKEKLQALHRTWRSSTAEEQERYSEKARKMPPPQQPADHSPDQKKILYKDALKNIAKQVSILEELGSKGVIVLAVDCSNKLSSFGTDKCLDWLNEQMELQYCFLSTCIGNEGPILKDPNGQERREVQHIFNRKYRIASGTSGRCSYKALSEGRLVAMGMPSGIQLKCPSAYGKQDLEAIIKQQDHIHFVLLEKKTQSLNTNTPPSATSDIQKKMKEPENMTKSTAEAGIENSLTNKQNKVDASQLLESLMKDDDSASEAKQGLPEGFYKVEKILKKRKKNGKTQYLVKWEGYEKASWEPEQNMSIFPS